MKRSIVDRILGSIRVDGNGCFNWLLNLDPGGYGTLKVNRKGMKAHRVSYETFRGPIPGGLCVCHRCDNRRCVNPAHLFLGTHKQNTEDAAKKNRMSHGESHHCSKLKESDVRRIFSLYNDGVDQQEIAKMFGVNHISVCKILAGKAWRHLGAMRTRRGPNFTGGKNPRAIVDESAVREMRRRNEDGETFASLAREFGLSHGGASRICRRQTWKHID